MLYDEFVDTGDREIVDDLLSSLISTRLIKCNHLQDTSISLSSRKAMFLLDKLVGTSRGQQSINTTTDPYKITSRIIEVYRAPS